ncbi:MAG: 3-deoxy-8-phosphooctulonate synthase [Krumholzibacteria bacterium]|nr:3-deoxy-8-phosphooctulonate synthase [Candidatus Krumholzibacteria bacterium]
MSAAVPVTVGDRLVGAGQPLYVIAGPCVLEDPDEMLATAGQLAAVCDRLGLGFCFKSSFTKDNRTSSGSYRGPGLQEGLRLLERIGGAVGAPVLTDIHHPAEADAVAQVAEILQIPAFLCRQTSLLEAAGRTGKVVNIKKGQFLAAGDMAHAAAKVRSAGGERVLMTERGSFFGYRDLVVDFRSTGIMRQAGFPVVFDATHSVQSPGSTGTTTGGTPAMIPLLARCGVAAGADAVFLEVHPEPARALSDAGSQLPLDTFAILVAQLARFRELHNEVGG